MSGLHIVLNKIFHIGVWQYSEYDLDSQYAGVLNMPGLHMVLNKIFHHRYLIVFWICLEFWICQCYTGLQRSTLFGSVLSIFPIFNMLGLKYTKVMDMPRLHIFLCKLYYKTVTNINSNTSSLVLVTSIFSKGPTFPTFRT